MGTNIEPLSHFQNGLAHRLVVKRVRCPPRDRLLGAGKSHRLNRIESQSAPEDEKKVNAVIVGFSPIDGKDNGDRAGLT